MTLTVFVLLGLGLGLNLVREQRSAQQDTEEVMTGLLQTTVAGLDNWQERETDLARVMAGRPEVVAVAQALLETAPGDLVGAQAQTEARAIFDQGRLTQAHQGFFLVSPQGLNLASSRDDNVGVTNLLVTTQTLKRALAGQAGMSPLLASDVPIERQGTVQANAPTLFSAAPVLDTQGQAIAVLLLRIDPTLTLEPVLRAARLGETGDVYAVNRQGMLMTSSAFPKQLLQLGLVEELHTEAGHLELRTPKGPLTRSAHSLITGNSGGSGQAYADYRGVPVIGAWQWYAPLDVGIIVEQDAAEAYAAHTRHQRISMIAALGGILLVGALMVAWHSGQADLDALNASLEERVAQRTLELLHANRTKSEFLARVSHDIRTPMNAVIGLLDLAQDPSTLDQERDDFLRRAEGSAQLLLGLLNDVLDLSRLQDGKLPLVNESFPLEEVLTPLRDLVFAKRAYSVDFVMELDAEVPQTVLGDRLRLAQALSNLVGNAAKFTPEGSITLSVRREPDDMLRFEVRDTGAGIDPAQVEDLMDAFTQASAQVAHSHGGSGLGLAICKGLAESMGGDLSMDGALGVGTTATLRVKLPKGRPVSQDGPGADLPSLEGMHILVVDDNQVNRIVARGMLERSGAQVSEAVNGEQALERMAEALPDLVLMDLQMPVMDGIEATSHARAQGIDIPILAMSAAAMAQDRARSAAAGMNGHLPKPVAREVLIRTVCRFVELSRGHDCTQEGDAQGEGCALKSTCAADCSRGSSEAKAS